MEFELCTKGERKDVLEILRALDFSPAILEIDDIVRGVMKHHEIDESVYIKLQTIRSIIGNLGIN
jgi:hypothetical protein